VPDVLKATYSDLKTVKTRSVCQLILELPIEALTDVVSLLGAPVPGNEVWVAVARLRQGGAEPGPAPVEAASEPEPPPRKAKSLAQTAGILCATGSFQKFVGAKSETEAADYIRGHCNVRSRADIDGNEEAERIFRDIKGEYDMWMAHPDAFAPRETKAA
jgi:hypothetical protein